MNNVNLTNQKPYFVQIKALPSGDKNNKGANVLVNPDHIVSFEETTTGDRTRTTRGNLNAPETRINLINGNQYVVSGDVEHVSKEFAKQSDIDTHILDING